jgi:hypothetical protein
MLAQKLIGAALQAFGAKLSAIGCPMFPPLNQLDGAESCLVSGDWVVEQYTL